MTNPPSLQTGSKVRLVSPAGAIEPELVTGAAACLKLWGLDVRIGRHATQRLGRFAGDDDQRLDDLQEAFDDPDCRAVFCTRGGYGTIRLLERIRWEGFQRSPKWLVGFSDITMLHACLLRFGIKSIHGGMAKALSESLDSHLESMHCLKDILFGSVPSYSCAPHTLNRSGSAEGILAGGNLSILYSLRGTEYDQIPEKSILFIEDIGEKPYVVDRMMYNLKLGGVLARLSGLIVGNFSDFEEDSTFGKTVHEIIADAVSSYSYPVCFEFPVGHSGLNMPLICGATVRLTVHADGSHLQFQ
jgi:muramoyltetrapeptide carboxypeptidase